MQLVFLAGIILARNLKRKFYEILKINFMDLFPEVIILYIFSFMEYMN